MRRVAWVVVLASVCLVLGSGNQLLATNGMNFEGYGPVSESMGGVSIAFENGTAAVMNNPSTLGLMKENSFRLDLALGRLGPNVNATLNSPLGSMNARSQANAFYMPALGLAKKWTHWTLGVGVFAQGGMGTEFDSLSWMADPSGGANLGLASGMVNRSEVSMGRVIIPVVWDVSDKIYLGGSVDFIWAGMDLQMAMSQSQFVDMASVKQIGTVGGSMVESFGMMFEPMGGQGIRSLHHAYFNFSNNSAFTGEAKSVGWAGKIGAVYQATPNLTVGATFHSKTSMGDLTSEHAVVSMGVQMDVGIAQGQAPMGQYMDLEMAVAGKIEVKNFEWPASLGVGAAYRVTPKLMVAFDLKRILWSDAMDQFEMVFTASDAPQNGGFANQSLDATLYQRWTDQMIFSMGGAYDLSERFQMRAGFNHAQNPVPDACLNVLFPAIVENHLTMGLGLQVSETSRLDFAVSRAFEKQCTNPGLNQVAPSVTSRHSQTNSQVMYSFGF